MNARKVPEPGSAVQHPACAWHDVVRVRVYFIASEFTLALGSSHDRTSFLPSCYCYNPWPSGNPHRTLNRSQSLCQILTRMLNLRIIKIRSTRCVGSKYMMVNAMWLRSYGISVSYKDRPMTKFVEYV